MLAKILTPISLLWDYVYRFRRYAYHVGLKKSYALDTPVISVGNISFGGTGKTPMILWLINFLEKNDLKTMVVTRGYKSKLEKKSGIINNNIDPKNKLTEIFGDEPTMISKYQRNKAVVVGRNRYKNILKYFSQVQPDCILLDDGFQHLKIERGVNILLFDANLPFEKYKTAPSGYLREGVTSIRDADVAIMTRCQQVSQVKISRLENMLKYYGKDDLILLRSTIEFVGIFDANFKKVQEVSELEGQGVLLVTAVANPQNVIQSMKDLKIKVEESKIMSDHYKFTQKDIDSYIEIAKEKSLEIITTEKDMVKISELNHQDAFKFLKVRLSLEKETRLVQFLEQELFT